MNGVWATVLGRARQLSLVVLAVTVALPATGNGSLVLYVTGLLLALAPLVALFYYADRRHEVLVEHGLRTAVPTAPLFERFSSSHLDRGTRKPIEAWGEARHVADSCLVHLGLEAGLGLLFLALYAEAGLV